jgi:hypothetical protein
MPLTLNGTTGEIFPSWTTAGRPSPATAGQTGYNSTLNVLETYNGSAWVQADLGPAFSAYQSSAQTPSSSTWTKMNLQAEEFDTANCFDSATNYRFTPNVAGYYQFNAVVAPSGTTTACIISLYKNGSLFKYGNISAPATVGSLANLSTIVYMNGTTDYAEAWIYLSASVALNAITPTTYNFFQGALVRAA